MKCRKIILFSLSIGTGHDSAARSILEAAREKGVGEVKIIDFFALAGPRVGKLITKSYFLSLKRAPSLYSKAYSWSEKKAPRPLAKVRRIFSRSAAEKTAAFLEEEKPDAVICTHPFPLVILSDLRVKGILQVPVVAVDTDYTVHPLWVQPGVDLFFVGAPETGDEFVAKGVPQEKIIVSGLPVAKKFTRPLDREECRRKLDLPQDLPVIMVMGGGLGIGPLDKVVKSLDRLAAPVTVTVITGNNRELYDSLEALKKVFSQDLRVYGYVENVEEFMAAADILITKPGGLTVAEALSSSLPMVIVDPLPGHEERNALFLKNAGLALVQEQNGGWAAGLDSLLASDAISKMRENAASYANPEAAKKIIDSLEGIVSERWRSFGERNIHQ